MIDVINLRKSFGDLEILKGINITINKGDIVAVLGPSGSGKSTFLRCLNCMEDPTSGSIIFKGVDIADMKSTDFPAVSLKTPPSFGSPGLGSPGSYGRTPGMPPTVGAGGTVNGLPDVATPPRSTPAEPLDVKEDEATREPTKMEGLDLLELDIDAK